jgi:DNA invertase Pin-like site-specific DNA recombinase
MLKAGDADALICSKLDRLGRDVGDFADLLKRSQREGWALVLLDLQGGHIHVDGEAAALMFAAIAQADRKRIGERTREAGGAPSGRRETRTAAARANKRQDSQTRAPQGK